MSNLKRLFRIGQDVTCNLDHACCYLSKSTGERCLSTKKEREHYLFEFPKRSFIYDEKRGYLLGIREEIVYRRKRNE